MRIWLLVATGLLPVLTGVPGRLLAQGTVDSWTGEWGQFQRVPAPPRDRFEGSGLSIGPCEDNRCQIALLVQNRGSQGDAKGYLAGGSATTAVAHLQFQGKEICSLLLSRTDQNRSAITVTPQAGDCSDFVTPGATFANTYSLRTRDHYFADDVAACFADFGIAETALCTREPLAAAQHKWSMLFLEVSDLSGPAMAYRVEPAEEQAIVKPCNETPSPSECLAANFRQAMDDLNARKQAWLASVTEPGNQIEAAQKLDAIAGQYRHSFTNGDVEGNTFLSTDTLQITKRSETSFAYELQLNFYNGHECSRKGIASYRRAGVFVDQSPGLPVPSGQPKKTCVFEVIPTDNGVKLADPTGVCRETDCGARGGYNGTTFTFDQKQ